MAATPPTRIQLPGDRELRRYLIREVRHMRDGVAANLEHLRPWMPWIAFEPLTLEQRRELLRRWRDEWKTGEAYQFGVWEDGRVIGGAGLMRRTDPGGIEIGYWIAGDRVGQGIVTDVAAALTDAAFTLDDVEWVMIQHDAANERSGRVPERLGFDRVAVYPREPAAPAESGTTWEWRVSAEAWLRSRPGPA